MGRPKLQKIAEVASFSNVFQNFDHEDPVLIDCNDNKADYRSGWKRSYFKNDNPLVLELGCGKGDYTVNLAEKFPDKNFIGIDVKGARLWTGAKYALENKVANAAFIRTRIEQLASFFAEGEVDEIWITFPDPFPRKGDRKRRLSHRRFLDIYKEVCKDNGIIHFKTDNKELFDFSVEAAREEGYELLELIEDVHSQEDVPETLLIKTHYEKMHIADGRKIFYFMFRIA